MVALHMDHHSSFFVYVSHVLKKLKQARHTHNLTHKRNVNYYSLEEIFIFRAPTIEICLRAQTIDVTGQ